MGRRKTGSKTEGEGGGSKRKRTPNRKMVKDMEAKSSGGGDAKISKPEQTSSGNGGVHPLTIDHILEKVFQYIIVPKAAVASEGEGPAESSSSVDKTVQSLRLVCKQWKDIATRLYRSKRAPIISFGDFDTLCRSHPKSRDEKMQNFLDVMKSSDLIPFQQYRIYPNTFVKENAKLLKDFMRICGPDAVHLHLTCDSSSTMRFSRRSFPDLNLAKLKTLKFGFATNRRKHFTSQIYELAYLLEMILSAAETLEKFVLTFVDPDLDWKWSQVLAKRFGECISKRIPKTVKTIFLDICLSDSHLKTLAESELKLESFAFVLDDQSGVSSKMIRKFFEKQAPTLKLLSICDRLDTTSSSVSLDLPRFPELSHLELDQGTIPEFSFADTFPKLTTLEISQWKKESTCGEFLNSTKKLMSLKKLYLPDRFPQTPLVKKAAKAFPNISKLSISPSPDISEALKEVFVYFENIEELDVTFPYQDEDINADSLFSGVSEDDCRRIKDDLNFDNVDLRDVQHRPSILNLAKLKKLVLDGPKNPDANPTDFSAHFLFLKMTSLKELHIQRNLMSAKYLDLLSEKLSLEVIY